MGAARALILFDIDGTLIRRAGPHHRLALVEAIRSLTDLETSFDGIDPSGTLDRDLIRLMMRRAGARTREIDAAMPEVVERAQQIYLISCPDLQRKVCPGVRNLLRQLKNANVPVGLVTGNLTAIGWKKMERAGLRDYFRFGAFAEMASTRAGLARIAIRQARLAGAVDRTARISLVGDHMNDVYAAKINGIRSIAVATGIATSEQLSALEPDVLVPDLRSLTLEELMEPGI